MKNLTYYMSLNYKVIITPYTHFDGSTYFIAEYEELEGLAGTGSTKFKALQDLEDVKEDWFNLNLELERDIPEPNSYAVNNNEISSF